VLVKEDIVKMAVVAFAFQGTFLKINQANSATTKTVFHVASGRGRNERTDEL
jgi:hypothetical protein